MVRGALAVVLWCAAASPARADDGYLARLAGAVRGELEAAAAAHIAKPVVPVPVTLKWRPQRPSALTRAP